MPDDRLDLIRYFAALADEELLAQLQSGALTETASAVAADEIKRRGLEAPVRPSPMPEADEYAGDYELIARFLNSTDAYLLRSCLEAAGVPAIVADVQLVQVHSLWAIALGGARVLVPATHVAEAKEVIAAFESGALALPDEAAPE